MRETSPPEMRDRVREGEGEKGRGEEGGKRREGRRDELLEAKK